MLVVLAGRERVLHLLEQTDKHNYGKCNVDEKERLIRLDAEPHEREEDDQAHRNCRLLSCQYRAVLGVNT